VGGPPSKVPGLLEGPGEGEELVQKSKERAERRCLPLGHPLVGGDAHENPVPPGRQGNPEEQPVDPRLPGVFRKRREALLPAARPVHAPPDAGVADPPVNEGRIVGPQAEPPPQGVRLEESGHFRGAHPASLEIEEAEERVRQRALPAQATVRDAEGDAAPVAARHGKGGLDEGGVALDLGRHHQDVGRRERRVAVEHLEDPVLEDLDLAHGAVAGVDPDRVVDGGNGCLFRAVGAPVAQVEDVGLDLRQEASACRLHGDVRLLAPRVVDHPKKVPAQGPHRGEQAVSPLQVQGLVGGGRPEPVDEPTHLAVGVDKVPVFPTGIHDKEVDVDGARDGLEDAEMEGGKGRDAEDGDPPGQRGPSRPGVLQAGEGRPPSGRPVRPGSLPRKQPP